MPNAATHLTTACDLLADKALRPIMKPLVASDAAQAAFLLGTISPDVRALSGHSREETHFFTIPPSDRQSAPEVMLNTYRSLADAHAMPLPQAAFVAGYITHLLMDQTWLESVVMSGIFVDGLPWNCEHPNFRLYSVLMVYMEQQAAARLDPDVARRLAAAQPDHWLPFVADRHLRAWRDHVAKQLNTTGAELVTVYFARLNDMPPDDLRAIVLSEERMAIEAYPIVPRARLVDFQQVTYTRCVAALQAYLADLAEAVT
jgi:hypothetical protein